MAIALEGVDLLALVLFAFLLAFLYALKWTITPLLKALHSALGWVPFAGDLIGKAERDMTNAMNGAIKGVRDGMGVLFAALVWSFGFVADGIVDLTNGFRQRWTGLLDDALPLVLGNVYSAAAQLVTNLRATVSDLTDTVRSNAKAAEKAARDEASSALSQAKTYTDAAVGGLLDKATRYADGLFASAEADIAAAKQYATSQALAAAGSVETTVEADIAKASGAAAAAVTAAVSPLSSAIDALRADLATAQATLSGEIASAEGAAQSALSTAVDQLTGSIASAESAAEQAASAALSGEVADLHATISSAVSAGEAALAAATNTLAADVSAAAQDAASALSSTAAQLQAAITAAAGEAESAGATLAAATATAAGELADVLNLPTDTIRDLLNKADLTTIGGFGVGVVLLRAALDGVLADTGLENSSCRSKVKGICGTDPASWGNLLAGLAAVGLTFDLAALAGLAKGVITTVEPIVSELAKAA